jgi:hypothetical protein
MEHNRQLFAFFLLSAAGWAGISEGSAGVVWPVRVYGRRAFVPAAAARGEQKEN